MSGPDKKFGQRKYSFHNLNVGEECLEAWNALPNGQIDEKRNDAISRAVRMYERRTGKKFNWFGTAKGLLIRRIL